MKKLLTYLAVLIPLFVVTGCSDKVDEEFTIIEIERDTIKKGLLEEELTRIQDEGIYGVSTKKGEYIIFNGVNNEYKDVDINLEDETLNILFSKQTSETPTKKIYELTPYPSDKYDTIQLIENGEATHFENVSVGN